MWLPTVLLCQSSALDPGPDPSLPLGCRPALYCLLFEEQAGTSKYLSVPTGFKFSSAGRSKGETGRGGRRLSRTQLQQCSGQRWPSAPRSQRAPPPAPHLMASQHFPTATGSKSQPWGGKGLPWTSVSELGGCSCLPNCILSCYCHLSVPVL